MRNMLVDELPAVLTAANNDTVQEQEMEVESGAVIRLGKSTVVVTRQPAAAARALPP